MTNPAFDLAALRRLSIPERLQLLGDLWDSIAEEAPDEALPLTPELAAELERRLAEHDANPGSAIPWDEVKERVLRKLRPNW
jgi:putative addiction module component (TIGR02574 family)